MPVQLGLQDFLWLQHNLIRRGFRRIIRSEVRDDVIRLRLEPPSPREGRVIGFLFYAKGLKVIVWTSFLESGDRVRKTGNAWVLVLSGDSRQYVGRPVRRTKLFKHNLLERACIARQRVLTRPRCETCDKYMQIKPGRHLRQRYWICHNTLPWDYGLSEEVLQRVKPRRKQRARYRAKRLKEGKPLDVEMKKHKGWKVGRPENLVSS